MEGKIFTAISNVMKEIGAVKKESVNDIDGYRYRGIDAIMNALNPVLVKNGIFVVPAVQEVNREERIGKDGSTLIHTLVKVRYTFFASDSSAIDVIMYGEGMDEGDKSLNKAMSAAYKYACFQTFCIPTEEFKDSEKESPRAGLRLVKPAGKDDVFSRIRNTKLFEDDEIFLIGSQYIINKKFRDVKETKAFLAFLNFCLSSNSKFEDEKMMEQYLRCKALAAEVIRPQGIKKAA